MGPTIDAAHTHAFMDRWRAWAMRPATGIDAMKTRIAIHDHIAIRSPLRDTSPWPLTRPEPVPNICQQGPKSRSCSASMGMPTSTAHADVRYWVVVPILRSSWKSGRMRMSQVRRMANRATGLQIWVSRQVARGCFEQLTLAEAT